MTSPKNAVYEDLRYRIITHDLAPMETLNEKTLMEHYGIGRTPLREILIRLEADGLIQRFPRSGTLVAPLDLQLLKQSLEIRLSLEGLAGKLAAKNITQEESEGLQKVLNEVASLRSGDAEALRRLTYCEFDFHNLVYQATHNRKLSEILHELHGVSARWWHHLVFGKEELLEQFGDHEKLLRALEKKDERQASDIAVKHVQKFVAKIADKLLAL